MHRAFLAAAAITWAIEPAWLSTILAIANREGPGPEAVAKELGRPLGNTRNVEMRGDVAVIPVIGPIFRRANVFSEVSGATSVQVLATDLHLALDAEEVSAIVLDIDSPGGEANGICELAEMIYAARGRKPIVAYVGGTGASAAYWIACACDRIYVSDTADVGSIGVVRAVPNPKADSAKAIEIVSSQSPNKRPDVLTDDGRAVYQAEVDTLAEIFVARVARNRGVSPEAVLEKFGRGGCLIGARAVAAGMADGLSSLEAVIASLSPSTSGAPKGALASSQTIESAPEKSPMAIVDPKKPSAARTVAEDEMPPTDAPTSDPPADKDPLQECIDACIACEESCDRCIEACKAVEEMPDCSDECRAACEQARTSCEQSKVDCEACEEACRKEMEGAAGDPDAAEDDPSDQSPQAVSLRRTRAQLAKARAQIRTLTSTTRANTRTAATEVLIAKAKADRKLTPALEAQVRSVAKLSVKHAQELVAALPEIPRLASVRNPPKAAKPEPVAPAGALTWNGKSYSELTMAEKHNLAHADKDLFDQMRMAHEAASAS